MVQMTANEADIGLSVLTCPSFVFWMHFCRAAHFDRFICPSSAWEYDVHGGVSLRNDITLHLIPNISSVTARVCYTRN